MRPWEKPYNATDHEILRLSTLGKKQRFGKHPLLLLIDIKLSCVGRERQPILTTMKEFPISCGEHGWDSAVNSGKLLEACRKQGIPVVHVTGDPHQRSFTHSSVKGTPPGIVSTVQNEEISPLVAPHPGELIVKKTKSSAFFGTPLSNCLRDMGADTLLMCGGTTSGCLRASVVDAYNNGFRCFVIEECCFDRFPLSHAASLWDMNAKYADVITLDRALKYVAKFHK